MYIRIEFENLESKETDETMQTFLGSPSGTCLSSSNSFMILPQQLREKRPSPIVFWYLDINILNQYYTGVLNALSHLKSYKGVKSIDILDVKDVDHSSLSKEEFIAFSDSFSKYIDRIF